MSMTRSTGTRQVRVPKAAELVADQLRRRIIRGELQEGEVLPPELALAAEFGVSRPSIREAMRLVEAERLIEIRRGARGGATVREPSLEVASRYTGQVLQSRGVTLADVYSARCLLEPAAVRLLVKRNDNHAIEVLEEILVREEEVQGDAELMSEVAADFHKAVVDLAGNETLRVMMGTLHGVIARHNADVVHERAKSAGRVAKSPGLKPHRRFIELLRSGDGDEAEDLWRSHLEKAADEMLRTHAKRAVLDVMS